MCIAKCIDSNVFCLYLFIERPSIQFCKEVQKTSHLADERCSGIANGRVLNLELYPGTLYFWFEYDLRQKY